MSTSETAKSVPLPAPVSLTLEEALQVAGGAALSSSAFQHVYIVNGTPWPDLVTRPSFNQTLQQNVGQLAVGSH